MQNRLIILLITAAVSLSSQAATCPPLAQVDPDNPPMGWSLLLPPVVEGQQYHFGKAIHSLNGSFFYGQIICVYQSCESFGCPAFSLLSDDTFEQPASTAAPWNQRPVIAQTLVCDPPNHDPNVCVFE